MKIKNIIKVIVLLFIVFLVSACSTTTIKNTTTTTTKTTTTTTATIKVEVCPICDNHHTKEAIEYEKLKAYTPTTFNTTSVSRTSLELADGIDNVTVTYTLSSNNHKVRMEIIEIDLSKASIKTGTYKNNTAFTQNDTLYNQLKAYEEKTNNTVYAITNADFFGNGRSVNAYVKDSVIVKDSHNDNGGYDYTNVNHDVPASMPMLFGVSGDTAQIAPMIISNSKKDTVQAKLFYELVSTNSSGTNVVKSGDIILNQYSFKKDSVNILFKTAREATVEKNSTLITLERHSDSHDTVHGKVLSIEKLTKSVKVQADSNKYYIIYPEMFECTGISVGDYLSYYINCPDNTWKYFDNIIGARQALVLDGVIPSTVNLENTNGAQSTNIPRTAIGIKEDGKVVLLTCESLRYGKKGVESDPYGVNLKELADFMRYYGCVNAANFDGGGSTQLIIRNNNELEVKTRSSDYGTYSLNAGRPVINSIIVISKSENNGTNE